MSHHDVAYFQVLDPGTEAVWPWQQTSLVLMDLIQQILGENHTLALCLEDAVYQRTSRYNAPHDDPSTVKDTIIKLFELFATLKPFAAMHANKVLGDIKRAELLANQIIEEIRSYNKEYG